MAKGLGMKRRRRLDVVDLLLRRGDASAALEFFKRLAEQLSASFADSAKAFPAAPKDSIALTTRGHVRRLYLDRGFRAAAAHAGYGTGTSYTQPPTWNFPVLRLGAFAVTLGVVDRSSSRRDWYLRSRAKYLLDHAARNAVLNPQGGLFEERPAGVVEVIPDGALGALVVVEPSSYVPDAPVHIGFMVPSPSLRKTYFRCSLERLIALLQERVAVEARPVRKPIGRKLPKLKKAPKRPDGR